MLELFNYITAQPEWILQPTNQEKSTGEKAVFECKAEGIPDPRYQWFINGVPYDDSKSTQYSHIYISV